MEFLCILMLYIGLFSLLLYAGYFILMVICFVLYKLDNGRLNFFQYAKRW